MSKKDNDGNEKIRVRGNKEGCMLIEKEEEFEGNQFTVKDV